MSCSVANIKMSEKSPCRPVVAHASFRNNIQIILLLHLLLCKHFWK